MLLYKFITVSIGVLGNSIRKKASISLRDESTEHLLSTLCSRASYKGSMVFRCGDWGGHGKHLTSLWCPWNHSWICLADSVFPFLPNCILRPRLLWPPLSLWESVDNRVILMLSNAFVKPHLLYCVQFCGPHYKKDIELLKNYKEGKLHWYLVWKIKAVRKTILIYQKET